MSFLPVFFLTGRDYKLFSPLAETKTIALIATLLTALIVVPFLSRYFIRDQLNPWPRKILPLILAFIGMGATSRLILNASFGQVLQGLIILISGGVFFFLGLIMVRERLRPIEDNPVSKLIQSTYTSILERSLRFPKIILCLPLLFLSLGLVSWDRLKTDDWIALDEGSFFYMPTLYPAVSFSQAMQVLQTQDQLISQIPEVKNVLGKIGRADTALDPAPTSMIETYVMLKPKSQWREGMDKQSIWSEILQRATLPGVTPASLLQPIEGRVVMLQSGIKANMAIRIYGDDLKKLARVTRDIAAHLKHLDSVNPLTVNPDIVLGKPYVEFTVDRKGASRYGLSVDSINQVIAAGLGGQSVTMTYEGRERYAVQVRYQRDYLEDVKKLGATPIVTNSGQKIPLRAVAKLQTLWGPAAISSENARLVAHVSFSPSATKGPVETVDSVMQSLLDSQKSGKLNLPTGYELEPVGSFQSQLETNRTLYWVIPLVVAINLVILYLMFKSWIISLLI